MILNFGLDPNFGPPNAWLKKRLDAMGKSKSAGKPVKGRTDAISFLSHLTKEHMKPLQLVLTDRCVSGHVFVHTVSHSFVCRMSDMNPPPPHFRYTHAHTHYHSLPNDIFTEHIT